MAVLTSFTVVQRVWHVRSQPARSSRRNQRNCQTAVTNRAGGVVWSRYPHPERNFQQMSTGNGAPHADGASTNGIHPDDGKVRVAIVGVGNCANSFIQGVEYYKDADLAEQVPGLMHVDLGGYHVRDIEFVAAFDIDSEKVGKDLSEAIWSGQNDTIKFADVPHMGVEVHRGMTHDGLGKYLKQKITKAPGPTADIIGILMSKGDVLVCYLPVGLRGCDEVVRRAGAPGRRRFRQLPARVHRPAGRLGQALRGRGPADHRRRHQVAGRRDDRPPPARPPVPRARRPARAHLAAERRRQYGLLQHARARAPRLEEDLEDQRRDLGDGHRASRSATFTSARRTTCRGSPIAWAHIRSRAPSATC